MRPLYIFDLDGTLALIDHRRHLVADKKNQRWYEFYRACVDDKPNKPVLRLLFDLSLCGDIIVFSGRSNLVEEETWIWLFGKAEIDTVDTIKQLKMRIHGDNTPDEQLKKRWYDELSKQDKDRLVCVFDDRQKVVDMWRSLGLTCLQVAPGDF